MQTLQLTTRDPDTRDMTLLTEQPVWFDEPWHTNLELNDFQIPVQNICRYNGALDWRLVRHLALGIKLALCWYAHLPYLQGIQGYFGSHDLHEIIVGDMVSGQKQYHQMFRNQEYEWEVHVHKEIGLPLYASPSPTAVKHLDLRALVVEMTMLKHPAAPLVTRKYGGLPSTDEIAAFKEVQSLELEECWAIVEEAIVKARAIYG